LGEKNLAAVTRRTDAGPPVHIEPDIPLVGKDRLTGVQPDPDADRAECELALDLRCCADGIRGTRKGAEEGVALRIHLDPAVRGKGVAHHAPVVVERNRVLIVELVQQLGRALDIREEECDGAGG
jgi:hypothetical protein